MWPAAVADANQQLVRQRKISNMSRIKCTRSEKVRPTSVSPSAIELAGICGSLSWIGGGNIEPASDDPIKFDRFLANDRFRRIAPAPRGVVERPDRHGATIGDRAAKTEIDVAAEGLQIPYIAAPATLARLGR